MPLVLQSMNQADDAADASLHSLCFFLGGLCVLSVVLLQNGSAVLFGRHLYWLIGICTVPQTMVFLSL